VGNAPDSSQIFSSKRQSASQRKGRKQDNLEPDDGFIIQLSESLSWDESDSEYLLVGAFCGCGLLTESFFNVDYY
jgi:hypothetical protein